MTNNNPTSSEKSFMSTILVPIDTTEETTIALHQSCNLAKLTNSKIVLLSVDDNKNDSAQKRLAELAVEAAEKSGHLVETILRNGNIYDEINKVADELNPLLMVGLSSKITFDKIIGKNAFKMVRELKHPVMTIRAKMQHEECKTILLPIDLSKESREKVGQAISLAKKLGAQISVVSILTQKDEELENKLTSYSNQVLKYIQNENIPCTIKTLRGTDIPKMIINYGHEIGADLILIMSKAELNVKEFFIGTVAQRIINESDIPVLSYRPMERKDTSVYTTF
ncbi:MAG: universal stress protein [Bacteroidia bacterium]